MNKIMTYLFIFMLTILLPKEVFAGTDVLCTVLTTCNSVLKEVGEVQNKISGKTREILSMKVSPGGLLDSFGLGDFAQKAEKLKEQGENLKEKAERVKEFAENAKEKAEDLKEQYNKLNDLAAEKFAQAQDTISKGRAIYEEYQNKAKQAVETYQEIKGNVQDVAASVEVNVKKEDTADDNQKTSINNAGSEETDISSSDYFPAAANNMNENTQTTPIVTTSDDEFYDEQSSATPVTNQADVITSATQMAEKTMKESMEKIKVSDVDIAKQKGVGVEDVINSFSQKKLEKITKKEIRSNVDLTTQLTGQANNVVRDNENNASKKITDDITKNKRLKENTNVK